MARLPWPPNCNYCGRFLSHAQMAKGGGASWVFVPDSDISYEENKWRCRSCTEKHGQIYPCQRVREDMCSGVM